MFLFINFAIFLKCVCVWLQENLDWDSIDVHMDPEVEIFPEGARGRIQRQLWSLFEHPNSSIGARVIGG